jgi:hypothetical protein
MKHLLPPSGTNRCYRVRVWVTDPNVREKLPAPYTGRDALIETTGETDEARAEIVALPIIDRLLRIRMIATEQAYPSTERWSALRRAAHDVVAERAWQALQPRPDPSFFGDVIPRSVQPVIVDVTPEPPKRCDLDTALDTWETHRYDIKKKAVREQQKRDARQAKVGVFKRLFTWGEKRGKPDPTDMASYTNDEMTTYVLHLANLGGSIALTIGRISRRCSGSRRSTSCSTPIRPKASTSRAGCRRLNRHSPWRSSGAFSPPRCARPNRPSNSGHC